MAVTTQTEQSGAVRFTPGAGAKRCRRKFLRLFPGGFHDPDYVGLERTYKWDAHRRWVEEFGPAKLSALLQDGAFEETAAKALRIEGRTNLVYSFEKMALRDATKGAGAEAFARGLDRLLTERSVEAGFTQWLEMLGALPRKQSRVLSWPVATVFGFLAKPKAHFFVKPTVMRVAAQKYGYELDLTRGPTWRGYAAVRAFAHQVRADLADLRPRDMIDIQSFLWIQGSDEYA